MKMDVYALNSERVEDFEKMMRNLEVVGTEKDFINYGFTNYDPPYLYFMRYVNKKIGISFGITITKRTMKIKEAAVLDEAFLQPYFVTENIFAEIKGIVRKMIKAGMFKIKTEKS